ncbi:type I restriction modification DNA specificity domain protein [Streptococcus oralis SK1074]|uniref:restriction endonuclease subunit S n=1 Tax=Streptococcus oralis TaxID=1303 RepID=UPI00025AAAC8|nr:restriction endonuclease subunit S [Streptococcus oralis]EID26122.1 type I restriction modification DNA specificity domain protein [Streptococcus oralis SK1074]
MEEKILPIIRFDNFNDYWRTSSLLSQVEVRRGLTYKPNDVRSKGARVLRSSNIVDDSFAISDDDVFVSKDVINIPRVSNGDILVTAANGSTKLVGKHAIIKNLPDDEIVVHGGFMLLFKTEQNYFVNAWMSSNEYKRVLQFVQGGNGAIGNLSSAILKSMKMSVPSFSEQSAIGSLFSTLDDLLDSYKDNLTNYQSLKATMLAKMFPKAGQIVPEIRLNGFEGEWKKLKLRDVVHTNPKSELPENFKYIDLESVVGTRIEKIREERKESAPSRAQRLAKKGDVFYQTVRPYQKNNYLFKLDDIDYVFSTGYAQLRPICNRCDSDFLLILLQNNRFLNKVLDRCTGTSYPAINVNDLIEILIAIPSYEEQQVIGAYFSNLDNLINSHQEKISQLETLKKKLLKDMFV